MEIEWYAVEVAGSVTDLMANLNAIEKQGYDIFSVVISPRGWTVVARMLKVEEKPKEQEKLKEEPEEKPPRGTIVLHKRHKK